MSTTPPPPSPSPAPNSRPSLRPPLIQIAPKIFLSPSTPDLVRPEDPSLVVFGGWMGAALPHLQKYVNLHREVFPGVPVLVLQSLPTDFLRRESTRRRALEPVRDLLPKDGRIFYHACSNGGSNLLTCLPGPVPVSSSVLLLDSSPGTARLLPTLEAFLLPFPALLSPLPAPLARLLAGVFLLDLLAPLRAFNLLTRNAFGTDAIATMRERLDTVFSAREVKRCYVYSKEDALIRSEDVESHAREAEEKGGKVKVELFTGPHVAHLKGERQRYIEVVRQLWQDGGAKARDGKRDQTI